MKADQLRKEEEEVVVAHHSDAAGLKGGSMDVAFLSQAIHHGFLFGKLVMGGERSLITANRKSQRKLSASCKPQGTA